MTSLYDFTVTQSNGEPLSLKEYEGKPLLIVNTASKCGFTPQFGGLQSVYEEYKDQGLTVLGFPCDQFNDQEFDDIDKTTEFCQVNYGVTFPMMAKIDVKGDSADPLFKYLTAEQKGLLSKGIKWNFTKFLVDRNGQVVDRFAPQTSPEKLKGDIEKVL
ncbi:glutathione peroxidase [Sporosarcina trichiuri]|uniref:glutathione peroxidase n=1 Tax=Sporosarcina trichiuri TaxID=3056445 RepID=UPI0025B37C3D|nr:glutathione peroxidase [Sporosarcina sp. 0.2-SM1T-5]WJY28094.1 glutathione peroxidase [Sporosarcina sp. 0.2-SM1T-5]